MKMIFRILLLINLISRISGCPLGKRLLKDEHDLQDPAAHQPDLMCLWDICSEFSTDYGGNDGKCRLNVTAAIDVPKPKRTKDTPEPERRGWVGLYIGLGLTAAAVLLVPLCFALSRCFTKSTDKTENSSSVV
ncbi:hypothetical protein Q5P01_002784 [Channa striata]|uniref:Uncharacterized protein n=1 Tax=Channa striata TaxID=64152 RepID=A0AA88T432_CHASR|nr:hypothetical protein Q5P01_002784 [Channa striata]